VRALAAALVRSPAVRALAWEAVGDVPHVSSLRVQAADRDAAALAILDAAASEDVNVLAISSPSPSLRNVRAATAAHLVAMRPARRQFGAPAPVQAAASSAPEVGAPAAAGPAGAPPPAASRALLGEAAGIETSSGDRVEAPPAAPGDAAPRPPEEEAAR
jgi:ABC-2 type transport system ATP-binding protein